MLTKTLAATAAISMLVGGGSALAQSKSSATAGPKQPIPYSQLNAYMKASPKARASKDWWAGSTAPTGMSTDTSATAPASTMSGSSMDSSSTGSSTSTDTSVNPSTSSSSPSMPSTPPTDGGTQPNGSTLPNPATPTDPMNASTGAPPQPK